MSRWLSSVPDPRYGPGDGQTPSRGLVLAHIASPQRLCRGEMGWYAKDGSRAADSRLTDCIKFARPGGRLPLPSVEPSRSSQRRQGEVFYTAYQGYIYGIAVPQDSAIKGFADLKASIGVASGSSGIVVARSPPPARILTHRHSGGRRRRRHQTAALVRTGQVDALSQYDAVRAGRECRSETAPVAQSEIEQFPANGFVAQRRRCATSAAINRAHRATRRRCS